MIRPSLLIGIALAAVGSPSSARPQAIITLDGFVRGENGGVARAQVSAVDSLTNERRNALTNERGYFRLLDLSPRQYVVSVRAIGYTPLTQTVDVVVGQRAHLEFVLQRSPVALDTVRVDAHRAQAGEIQRMSVSTAVTEHEIQNLPLNSRNILELASVAPGVRMVRPVSGMALPAAGAMRDDRGINLYVDGIELKNMLNGSLVGAPQSGSLLPADGLQEFRVFLNPYDAEYTRGASYVISAVSHRGSNLKQGSVFGFFQNGSLVSVSDFQRQIQNFKRPDFSRRHAGFTLRGPFVHDRLFYATSYELTNSENAIAVVPGRPPANAAMWDEYAGIFTAPNRNQTGLLRLTYARNDRSVLDAIWSSRYMTGESGFGGQEGRESAVRQKQVVNTVKLGHRWLPSSRLSNELSLQLVDWSQTHRPLFPGPALQYPTLVMNRSNGHFENDETRVQVVDRLTVSAGSGPGSHLLKGGLEITRVMAKQFHPEHSQGTINFMDEGDSLPNRVTLAVGAIHPDSDRDAAIAFSGWVAGGYVNDEWHVASGLVLNLGVRYDVEINTLNNRFTVPWASDSVASSIPELRDYLNRGNRRTDLDNVSPRVSFSWDVGGNQRMYLRGGFGIMYDRVPGRIALDERRSATWRTYVFSNPGTKDVDELRKQVLAGGVPPTIDLLPRKMEAPENRQWSVGIGAQLTRTLTLNADFIDQGVRKLFAQLNLNAQDLSVTPAERVLSSEYGLIIAWGDFARARHRALLTSLSYGADSSRRLNLAYTLASAKADWDGDNVPVPTASAAQFYTMQRISGDERHRFVLSGVWAFPFGLGLSTITTVASPRPYRTRLGMDTNKNGFPQDDWVDGMRYRAPGNAWKYWYRVVDLRLTKAIDLGRDARLSVIVEGFNIFNTENFAGYFGVQKNTRGVLRSDFGTPSAIFTTRQVQLGTKLEF